MRKILLVIILFVAVVISEAITLKVQRVNQTNYLYFRIDKKDLFRKDGEIDYIALLDIADKDDKIISFAKKNIKTQVDDYYKKFLLVFTNDLPEGDYTAYLKIKSRNRGDKNVEKFNFTIGDRAIATELLFYKDLGEFYLEPENLENLDTNEYNLYQKFSKLPTSIQVVTEKDKKIVVKKVKVDSVLSLKLSDYDLISDFTDLYTEVEIDGQFYHFNLPKFESLHKFQKMYSWQDQLQQIRYIVKQTEWRKIQANSELSDKERVLQFWERMNPNGLKSKNSLQLLLYDRIFEVDKKFSVHKYKRGWETDRGRIFIKYGEPDEIEVDNYPIGKFPTQTWTYYAKQKTFYFYDRSRIGDYKLYNKEEEYDY
jgi:GWxTD domain-containing protein